MRLGPRVPTPKFTDLSWQADGVCREIDPEIFYADAKEPHHQQDALTACGLCDPAVRAKCLLWAIDNDEEWGIWGGATPAMRVNIAELMRRRPDLDVLGAAAMVEDDPTLRVTYRWKRTSGLRDADEAAAA